MSTENINSTSNLNNTASKRRVINPEMISPDRRKDILYKRLISRYANLVGTHDQLRAMRSAQFAKLNIAENESNKKAALSALAAYNKEIEKTERRIIQIGNMLNRSGINKEDDFARVFAIPKQKRSDESQHHMNNI